MSDDIKLTAVQRSAAISRAGENIALLSGAGCGKTLVLARRFTELLMADPQAENPLSRFVALTFTDKAALEMSQRVGKMLSALAADSKGDDRRRLLDWLQQLPEARISTIHSFCASLLRAYAVEAGVDPGFAVCADKLVADQMLADAAEKAILEAADAGRADAVEALALLGYPKLTQHVVRLIELRTSWNGRQYRDPEATMARWTQLQADADQAAWEAISDDEQFARSLAEAESLNCTDSEDKLEIYRRRQLATVRQLLGRAAPAAEVPLSELSAKPGTIGSAKAWGGKDAVRYARDLIKAVVARAAPLAIFSEEMSDLDKRSADLLGAMTRLAEQAEGIYAAEKRRRGLLDFTDLLVKASDLLRDRPAVAKGRAGQIDQLLLDEAQDTNAFQTALLETLVFGSAGGESLSPGRLFVVGDDKQSIYRFRGAQVEVFQDLCRRLGPSQRENLSTSFRTHAAGVAFVNHLFAPLMGADYQPIKAHRQVCPPAPAVEIIIASGDEGPVPSAAAASAAQAAATAQRIEEMVDRAEPLVWDQEDDTWRPVQYGDVAILFNRMTNSLDYERQLALRSIDYYVVGGTGFFKQQEVYDLLNALRAVDNAYDDVAFFGFLRGSMVGLDDNALMHIAEAIDPPYLPKLAAMLGSAEPRQHRSEAIAGLPRRQSETLALAVSLIGRLHRRKDAVGIDVIIDQLLAETGYEATLLAQFQGRRLVGNVRHVAQRARSVSAQALALADFIVQMNQQILSESRYEQAAVTGEQEDVVRLMTIHKAKGLEFPVVIVPDLNAAKRGPSGALLLCEPWGLTYKLQDDQDEGRGDADGPLPYRLARRCDQAADRAEDLRRLYVAATRHEDHLVFVGADWRTKDGRLRQSGSFLATMDQVLDISGALSAGAGELRYGPGREYSASVRKVTAAPPKARRSRKGPAMAALAMAESGQDLAEGICKLAAKGQAAPPLLGPLPATVGRAELAVTALSDFEYCPMLFRWRHELNTPPVRQGPAGTTAGEAGLDAATMGTLYHCCMELLDFASPQPAETLLRQAASQMQLEASVDLGAITVDLHEMLQKLRLHPLPGQIAAAKQTYRELDFVMQTTAATLRGQIDLLYQDRSGLWHIVDYKSDRLTGEQVPGHSRRYELQMLSYAAAAARHVAAAPAETMLYYLRPAETYVVKTDAEALAAGKVRIDQLAEQLTVARRAGSFARRDGDTCETCPYGPLCQSEGV